MSTVIQSRLWHDVSVFEADDSGDDLLSVDRSHVLEQFRLHGAVLFRSFSIGIDRLQALVRSFSTTQIPYPGSQRSPVSSDGKVQTVDVGARAIPLHSELSHTPFRPDVCWFYCVKAPTLGSQTILCDGALVAAGLPDSTFHLLEDRLLCYRRTTPIAFLEKVLGTASLAAVREFIATHPRGRHYQLDGDRVRQDFVTSALTRGKFLDRPVLANNILHNFRLGAPLLYPTFAAGEIIPQQIILEMRKAAQRVTFEIDWRDQDLLMLDNTRFMHGRRAIIDPERTIWTQFSDIDS